MFFSPKNELSAGKLCSIVTTLSYEFVRHAFYIYFISHPWKVCIWYMHVQCIHT